MLVSVTRLRLRSIRFLPGFAWYASRSSKQALAARGCGGVRTRKTRGLAFWTLSLWDDEAAMREFRGRPPHGTAMGKLSNWCDESAVAHWTQESTEWPAWEEAVRNLETLGRQTPLRHPSKEHEQGRIVVT